MALDESTDFQPFAHAVQQAIDMMHRADARLRALRSAEHVPEAEQHLLHLISLTALVEQQGRHLLSSALAPVTTHLGAANLPSSLKRVYDDLVTHLPDESDFVTLQFVLEVGAVYRGVVRHVGRP